MSSVRCATKVCTDVHTHYVLSGIDVRTHSTLSGTDIRYDATSIYGLGLPTNYLNARLELQVPMQCPVLRYALSGPDNPVLRRRYVRYCDIDVEYWKSVGRHQAYAPATGCPLLTQQTVLPDW